MDDKLSKYHDFGHNSMKFPLTIDNKSCFRPKIELNYNRKLQNSSKKTWSTRTINYDQNHDQIMTFFSLYDKLWLRKKMKTHMPKGMGGNFFVIMTNYDSRKKKSWPAMQWVAGVEAWEKWLSHDDIIYGSSLSVCLITVWTIFQAYYITCWSLS